MIKLVFVRKNALLRVFIKDRIITTDINNIPIQLDINKAAQFQDERMTKLLEEVGIKDFTEFVDDEACAKSIIKDLQESGWRCSRI